MSVLPFKNIFSIALLLAGALLFASLLSAWTGPTATAPSGNVAAPINVGTTDQVKDAGISVNSLAVFGSQYLQDKLGIGVASPVVSIETDGTLKIGNGGEVCQAVTEGAQRYNTSSNVMEFCDGSSWTSLGSGSSGSAGAVQYAAPGTYTFVVPTYSSMTVTVSGAGSGGGGGGAPGMSAGTAGAAGGASSFNSSIVGNGGTGGTGGGNYNGYNHEGSSGSSGTASGGGTNTTGGGASGGGRGVACGSNYGWDTYNGGNGAAGGKAVKTYASGDLTPGNSITVVVGAGGTGGVGGMTDTSACATAYSGQNGSVTISWQ